MRVKATLVHSPAPSTAGRISTLSQIAGAGLRGAAQSRAAALNRFPRFGESPLRGLNPRTWAPVELGLWLKPKSDFGMWL